MLFIDLPYYGNVVSTIELVKELIRRECQVTYLLTFGWKVSVEESGADSVKRIVTVITLMPLREIRALWTGYCSFTGTGHIGNNVF